MKYILTIDDDEALCKLVKIRLPTKISVPSFPVGPPSQRLPCLWLPLEARYHSLRPPFAKRGVWNSFSISLLVR